MDSYKNPFMNSYSILVSKHQILHDKNYFLNRFDIDLLFTCLVGLGFWYISLFNFTNVDALTGYQRYIEYSVIFLFIPFIFVISIELVKLRYLKHAYSDILSQLGTDVRLKLAKEMKLFSQGELLEQCAHIFEDKSERLKDNLLMHAKNLISDDSERHRKAVKFLFGYEYSTLTYDLNLMQSMSEDQIKQKNFHALEEELDQRLSQL